MNERLRELFEQDEAQRQAQPPYGSALYTQMRSDDAARRLEVRALLDGEPLEPEDLHHAAVVLHHGETLDDINLARRLASRAAEAGHGPSRYLAASTLDRWLMVQGLPQVYGTNIVPDGRGYRVWDTEPSTTDDQRAEWDVPPLEQLHERARQLSLTEPPFDIRNAPWWLRDAAVRWRRAEGDEQGAAELLEQVPVARRLATRPPRRRWNLLLPAATFIGEILLFRALLLDEVFPDPPGWYLAAAAAGAAAILTVLGVVFGLLWPRRPLMTPLLSANLANLAVQGSLLVVLWRLWVAWRMPELIWSALLLLTAGLATVLLMLPLSWAIQMATVARAARPQQFAASASRPPVWE